MFAGPAAGSPFTAWKSHLNKGQYWLHADDVRFTGMPVRECTKLGTQCGMRLRNNISGEQLERQGLKDK